MAEKADRMVLKRTRYGVPLLARVEVFRAKCEESMGSPVSEAWALRELVRRGLGDESGVIAPIMVRSRSDHGATIPHDRFDHHPSTWRSSGGGGSRKASAPVRTRGDSPIKQTNQPKNVGLFDRLPKALPAAVALAGEVEAALREISDVPGFALDTPNRALVARWCQHDSKREVWLNGVRLLRRLDVGYLDYLGMTSVRDCFAPSPRQANHRNQPALMSKLYSLGMDKRSHYKPSDDTVSLSSILRGSAWATYKNGAGIKDWTVCPIGVKDPAFGDCDRFCELMADRSPGVWEDIMNQVQAYWLENMTPSNRASLRDYMVNKSGLAVKYKGLIRPIIEAALGPQRIRSEAA